MTINGSTPPIDAWQVEFMRITAFPGEVVPIERLSWWDDVVGFPPEAVVSRPKAGQYQAHGDFEGRRLALQIQPGRIDWNMSPAAKSPEDDFALLGPFPEVLTSLARVATAWLPQAPGLKRIALGTVLVQPVADVKTGHVLIQKYLPNARIDLEGPVLDFLFQINRPRMSTTGILNLRMNRLTKWSVQVAQRVTIMLGQGGVVARTLGEEAVCRLELDINTSQDFGPVLPAEHLGALLREMIDLGREIAQKGDVR